ncbi:MAG: hypothetical protein Ct9H300mP14_14550 [Gammaproteobacteria bacterium]|nr:MAG: hypothetical protein Ct9H300mP14_14550 [Gammaproteobacteria bacterium]
MRLIDKVAIVTGAASGMGASTAELFAAEGARVIVTDLLEAEGTDVGRESVTREARPVSNARCHR